jgi:integrase
MGLTVKRVARLLGAGAYGRHPDRGGDGVRGLYLCIKNKNNASWALRYQLAKRTHWMGLGSARDISLAKARERARVAREKLSEKIDPLEQRRAEQAARAVAAIKQITFAEATTRFIDQHEAGWKNARHREQVTQTLRQYAFPVLGDLPVAAIDTPLVLKVIEPLWKTKTETASRLRGRIENVLAWATVRGYRAGDNPARWRGHLEQALPKPSAVAKPVHLPALAYPLIPTFLAKLRTRQGVAAQALLFTILTAARTQEALGARWSEIDLKERIWTVPAARMKSHREHHVPLSDAAVELLRSLYREGDGYLFIGSRPRAPLNPKALHRLLARMRVDATVHGFRSSFRTWAAEQTNYPREVAEQALAHTIPDAVERAYKRTTLFDKRRQLMALWSKFCASPSKAAADNVVAIREHA